MSAAASSPLTWGYSLNPDYPATNPRNPHHLPTTSSRFFFVINSCPAPSTTTNSVRAGISCNAAVISSTDPNPSRVPITNIAAVSNSGKCPVRNSSGRCRWMQRIRQQQQRLHQPQGSAAHNIEACLPPYECPPRNTRPPNQTPHRRHRRSATPADPAPRSLASEAP